MICPLCFHEMDFDLNTNRFTCSRSSVINGGPPTYVLDATTLEQIPIEPQRPTPAWTEFPGGGVRVRQPEELVQINPYTVDTPVPPYWVTNTPPPPITYPEIVPPWWIPQTQFVPAPEPHEWRWGDLASTIAGQMGVPAMSELPSLARIVDERTEREKAREWFNPMPKALKLLYIALDPEIADVLHHYKEWDARKMNFREFCGSTQRVIVKAYAEKHPS